MKILKKADKLPPYKNLKKAKKENYNILNTLDRIIILIF